MPVRWIFAPAQVLVVACSADPVSAPLAENLARVLTAGPRPHHALSSFGLVRIPQLPGNADGEPSR